jgi:hypothetical protein
METPKRVASASPTRKVSDKGSRLGVANCLRFQGRKSMVAPQSSSKSVKVDDDDSDYDKMSKSLVGGL